MQDLTDRQFLITGATGRVGRRLTDRLLAEGARVRVLVLPGDPGLSSLPARVQIVMGSLNDTVAVRRAIVDVTHVIHLAATMDWRPGTEDSLFSSNISGTHVLLRELSARMEGLERLVFASSDEVYPSLQVGARILEDRPLAPYSFYGLTKEVGERFVLFHHRAHGLPVTVVRFSLIAEASEILQADGWSGRLFFASGIRALLEGLDRHDAVKTIDTAIGDQDTTLVLPRDPAGDAYRFQFCDVRDLVEGLLQMSIAPDAIGEVFNLSGPEAFSYEDAVPYLATRTGRSYVDLTLPGNLFDVQIDIDHARRQVGYQPTYDIRSVIDDATAVTQ